MKTLCRLCAKEKSPNQLMCSIEDKVLNIEQKLIDCCRWNSFVSNNEEMPKMICDLCFKSLEESWAFAETVALAQQYLLEQLIDIKFEVPYIEPIETINLLVAKEEPIEEDDIKMFMTPFEPIPNFSNQIPTPSTDTNFTYTESEIKIKTHAPNIRNDQQQIEIHVSSDLQQENQRLSFLCETCGKYFTTKSNLLTHTKMHLPIEKRKHYECYICKSTFSYKKSLIHHMPTHCGKKIRFQCKVCLVHFSRTDALRRHSLIHLGKFTHQCKTCGKGFRTKFNLKVLWND